jgi:hypothetical protein
VDDDNNNAKCAYCGVTFPDIQTCQDHALLCSDLEATIREAELIEDQVKRYDASKKRKRGTPTEVRRSSRQAKQPPHLDAYEVERISTDEHYHNPNHQCSEEITEKMLSLSLHEEIKAACVVEELAVTEVVVDVLSGVEDDEVFVSTSSSLSSTSTVVERGEGSINEPSDASSTSAPTTGTKSADTPLHHHHRLLLKQRLHHQKTI